MTKTEIVNLHRDATVFLGYVNPWIEYSPHGVSAHRFFTESAPWMEATIPMLRKGGVDIVVLSHGINDKQRLPGPAGVEYMLRCLDALTREIEADPGLILILTKRDLDRALREGKLGIILHITGAPLNGDLAMLRTYFRMGVRAAHPFVDDAFLGGFADGPNGANRLGLQPFGRKVVREMERLGILLDVAHTSDRTFRDIIRFAEKPLIDSHTNCRAIADYDRCCTDDQLRAIAKRGGVIGAHFGFLEKLDRVEDARHRKMMRAFHRKLNVMQRRYKDPYEFLAHRWDPFEWPLCLGGAVDDGTRIHRAKLSQLRDHIEHMIELAGIDHVGIGSDYSSGCMPEGVETAESLVNLTRELVRRGFSATEIKKIWGGNFLRLLETTLPS